MGKEQNRQFQVGLVRAWRRVKERTPNIRGKKQRKMQRYPPRGNIPSTEKIKAKQNVVELLMDIRGEKQ